MEQVVNLIDKGDGIVHMIMQDKTSKNTFSQALVRGLVDAFEAINATTKYKVVVLSGYENYFCCGGTKEELFRIYNKDIKFTELDFYNLPLTCKIPVISAMQGHGIGGGLVFGLYADIVIMGNENIYTTNFMKYGFTPGMGATLIVPYKLGATLGNEMLFTAESYKGRKLKERVSDIKIVPKEDVLKEAFSIARLFAEKPSLSLKTLKKHMTAEIREKLPLYIEKELEMHDITFHNPEVANRIEQLFGS
ncbi:polyketide synthase [Aquimarina aggregata]|uniref:polyketide synthase n=1 Tax=Aquimarina aggregata TaxID=1642818 RepID=UPI00248F9904|nr:polyketide synthase [Aquimarina aggregata]